MQKLIVYIYGSKADTATLARHIQSQAGAYHCTVEVDGLPGGGKEKHNEPLEGLPFGFS